jgi:hypothetical protein
MRKISNFFMLCLIFIVSHFINTAEGGQLTCTQFSPCTLSDLLVTGNYFVVNGHGVTKFSNFDQFGYLYGSSSNIYVYGEFADIQGFVGYNPAVVIEPKPGVSNPWRIDSVAPNYPSVQYSSELTYDVQYTNIDPSYGENHIMGGELAVTYGQMFNSGGLELTGRVSETLNNSDLVITCQELEVNYTCQNQEGKKQLSFYNYVNTVNVSDYINLNYVQFTGKGGTIEVNKIENNFAQTYPVGNEIQEPNTSFLIIIGLACFGFYGKNLKT